MTTFVSGGVFAGGPQSYAASRFATAIIDKQIAVVDHTIATLGQGVPTTGIGYQETAQRLEVLASEITKTIGVALWDSPAGLAFASHFERLSLAVQKTAETDQSLALVMDQQAAAVTTARQQLREIEHQLFAARAHALGLNATGNVIASQAVQEAAVQQGQKQYTATMANLTNITTTNTSEVTTCCASLDDIEGSLNCGNSATASATSTTSLVDVAPDELLRMATAVKNCSAPLAATTAIGPQILQEVALTHGCSTETASFYSSLTNFTDGHIAVLWTVQAQIESHAERLNSTGRLYAQCDIDQADDLQFDFEEDF
ncbi:MAG: hypothetical protein K2Q25_00840 [Mycobacteriaceae bacterium]|nr:hypothetical protein [Mycobacteriaceae bacterium]